MSRTILQKSGLSSFVAVHLRASHELEREDVGLVGDLILDEESEASGLAGPSQLPGLVERRIAGVVDRCLVLDPPDGTDDPGLSHDDFLGNAGHPELLNGVPRESRVHALLRPPYPPVPHGRCRPHGRCGRAEPGLTPRRVAGPAHNAHRGLDNLAFQRIAWDERFRGQVAHSAHRAYFRGDLDSGHVHLGW